MALMVVVVARKRVFWLHSGIGGAGVEQTAQKNEKQGWIQIAVEGHDGGENATEGRASSQHQLMGVWLLLQQKQWVSKTQQIKEALRR